MGQYYYPIILDADGKIVVWMDPTAYVEGQKLMEHAYLRNPFVNTFEFALSPEGPRLGIFNGIFNILHSLSLHKCADFHNSLV